MSKEAVKKELVDKYVSKKLSTWNIRIETNAESDAYFKKERVYFSTFVYNRC